MRGDGPWEAPPPNVATASSYPCTWSENHRPPAGSLPVLARSDARTKAEASALWHPSRPRQHLASVCVLCLWPSPPRTPGSSPSSLAALRALPRPHLLLARNSRNWRAGRGGGHLSPPTSACNFLLPLWGAPPPPRSWVDSRGCKLAPQLCPGAAEANGLAKGVFLTKVTAPPHQQMWALPMALTRFWRERTLGPAPSQVRRSLVDKFYWT